MSEPFRARAQTRNITAMSFPKRWRSLRSDTNMWPRLAACGRKRRRVRRPNAFWQNQSFHNYADSALSHPFQSGLARLRALGQERRCAIMCAEAVWWRCHRRIIADYLIVAGESVFHILGADHVEPAHMTEAARWRADGSLVYGA